jgi:virulence-associated protein VapD
MATPKQENKSTFQNFQKSIKVFNHKHSDKFDSLKSVKIKESYRLKAELDSYAFKGTLGSDYLNDPKNHEFTQKMMYMENYEKYQVNISKYQHLDMGQMRFNFGQQASIHLIEGLDDVWKHMRRLLI